MNATEPVTSFTKINMDTSQAMALLGFSCSTTFESTDMSKVQEAFMYKVHTIELQPVRKNDYRAKKSKKDELRKVNEAFQFLTKKRKQLSGRSMLENWQSVGGKSSVVKTFIGLQKTTLDQPVKPVNPLKAVLMEAEHSFEKPASTITRLEEESNKREAEANNSSNKSSTTSGASEATGAAAAAASSLLDVAAALQGEPKLLRSLEFK